MRKQAYKRGDRIRAEGGYCDGIGQHFMNESDEFEVLSASFLVPRQLKVRMKPRQDGEYRHAVSSEGFISAIQVTHRFDLKKNKWRKI